MRISFNWLQEYLDMTDADGHILTPEELAQKLEKAGIDVEGVQRLDYDKNGLSRSDTLIDVRVSREFSDWTAMMWTVNELCGILGIPVATKQKYGQLLPDSRWTRNVRETELFVDSKTDKCRLITGRVIGSVAHRKTPAHIRDAVIVNGCTPVDTVTDLAHYAVRNLGQPLFLLDKSKLPGKDIVIRESDSGGEITVDGRPCSYEPGDLILTSGESVIGIGGVLIDDKYKVTDQTTGLVVLTAVIDADEVLKFRNRYGLNDLNTIVASAGSNHSSAMKEMVYITSLYFEYAEGKEIEELSIYNKYDFVKSIIFTSVGEVNALLDTAYRHIDIVPAVVNAGISMTVLEPVRDEAGAERFIGVCEASPLVGDTTQIGAKFSSFRSRRSVNDFAQTIISLTGCDQINC